MTDDVTVHHGDALDVLAGMPDASVDAVVTDPPYNLSFMAKPWDAYEGREDAGFAYWLAGLIDGEGHFAIKRHSRGTHAPYFQLKMRADERGTLDRIKRTTGIGVVSTEDRTDGNPLVKWTVQDKEGCQRLVDLLDKYQLRAKKRLDYLTWREAVCEWTERPRGNRWQGGTDNTRMAVLRDRIMATRAYTEIPWSGHEYQDWCRLWAQECLRLLKPGGHLLAFGGTRTFHRLTCAIEDAGFEIRDCISYLFGAGFPKSLDVSKAIDRAAGAEREVVGTSRSHGMALKPGPSTYVGEFPDRPPAPDITAPATDDARRWQGWGTALKPAWEPVIVARKPLAGTVAGNVLAHGTGALNIDGTRIGTGEDKGIWPVTNRRHNDVAYTLQPTETDTTAGRWPANVVLDEDAADQLDRQSGTVRSAGIYDRGHVDADGPAAINIDRHGYTTGMYGDTGGASRFYYTAKAAPDERPRVNGVSHPTIKPLDLMRWLVRLVTPPGGLVLDPFAGSGTTGEACIIEGFRCVLIENWPDYWPLIEARLSKPIQPTLGGTA